MLFNFSYFTHDRTPVINTQNCFFWTDQGLFCMENLSNSTLLERSSSYETKFTTIFSELENHTLGSLALRSIHFFGRHFGSGHRTNIQEQHCSLILGVTPNIVEHIGPWTRIVYTLLLTMRSEGVTRHYQWRFARISQASRLTVWISIWRLERERERPDTLSPPLSW